MERKASKNEGWKMLAGYSRGLRHFFFISVFASMMSSLTSFIAPLIIGFTVDSVIGGKASSLPGPVMAIFNFLSESNAFGSNLLICALLSTSCALLSGFFNYNSRISMAKGSEHFVDRLRTDLYTHTQNLPFEWHTKNQTGDIIQRCTSDVETARRFIFGQLIEVLRTTIMLATAMTIMFSLNALMAVVLIVFIPVISGYTMYFYKQVAKKFRACDEAEGELMVTVQENLTGVRVVRAFGREVYETEQFDIINNDYTQKWISLGGTYGSYWAISDSVASVQLLSIIIIGSYLATRGILSFGELLVFISYTQMVTGPVRQLGRVVSEMSRTSVALARIREIFDAQAESDPPDALEPPMDSDIEFKNVSFSYHEQGEQPVLKNISFTIKSGTTFGILGATGSGKSTLTYLLNRLYDLPENGGAITIGGVDIKQIGKKHLRRNIGLVLQEPFLFSKTIFENIDIAARSEDLDTVREKAEIAAVDDNIMSFAKAYDTVVGERGVTLSGGQKQRIAIARTLMMNAPVLVFDDSMSSLDMETDAKIRESLRADTAGATVILISHRISTLMKADTILVLENGEIAEMGSHSELVELDGIYRRIYDLQSGYVESEISQ